MIDRMPFYLHSYIAFHIRSPIEISHGTRYTRTITHRAAALIYLFFTFILTVNMKYMALQDDRYSDSVPPFSW